VLEPAGAGIGNSEGGIRIPNSDPRIPNPTGRPIRVLHVVEATIAGVKRYTLDLLAGFKGRPDIVQEVACPPVRDPHHGDTSFVSDVRRLGVPVHLVPMRRAIDPRSDLANLIRLARLIRRGRYDVLHLHSSKAGVLGRAAAWLAFADQPARRPRLVYTPNAFAFLNPDLPRQARLYVAIERAFGLLTDRMIVVSHDEAREALSRHIIPPAKTRLVRHGVDPRLIPDPAAAEAKRRELGWGPRDGGLTVIGTAGRMSPQKDPRTWVRAAALAARQRPTLRFVWVGNGDMEDELRALAGELGLEPSGQLEWLGYRADAREVIAAMDVFSLTSVFEAGLPYVLMEAMAAHLPVVAAAGSGLRELIRDGVTGYLVPCGDAGALADRALRLADDPALRCRFGRAGHELILEHCTLERQIAETARVYYDALGSRPATSAP